MNMVELIERLEGASGPDRELDRAIFAALNPTRTEYCYENGKHCIHSTPCQTPRYSRSIDAALTLVPDNNWLDIRTAGRMPGPNEHKYPVVNFGRYNTKHVVQAPTIPLALCIAALKARASIQETEK